MLLGVTPLRKENTFISQDLEQVNQEIQQLSFDFSMKEPHIL